MRISDWSSDVCSSDLLQYLADRLDPVQIPVLIEIGVYFFSSRSSAAWAKKALADFRISLARRNSRFSFSNALRRSRSSVVTPGRIPLLTSDRLIQSSRRSEEHTSELQSLMRISYAVFCLKKKIQYSHLRTCRR